MDSKTNAQALRIRFVFDDDADYSWLEMDEEADDYYRNPDNHTALGMIVEEQCRCCGNWKVKDSLWGIDFMVTDNFEFGTFDADELPANEYQQQLIKEAYE